MHSKLAHIVSVIFFIAASFSSARRLRNCEQGNQCIPLNLCPQMMELINSGRRESINIVQNNICGYVWRWRKVCCPTTLSSTTIKPSIIKTVQPVQPVSLLPTKCGRPVSDDKISNGKPAPIEAYPWIAAMGYTEPGSSKVSFKCAGAIISKKYVLTAAHCLDPDHIGSKRLSVIHLGDYNLSTERDCAITLLGQKCSNSHIIAGIEETVSHPMYNKRGMSSDDIALIRLDITLNFDSNSVTIEPVCIPPNGFNSKAFAGNRSLVAAGWGLTEHGIKSDILLRVRLPIADDALCKKGYGEKFVGNQLCVGGTKEGYDTCRGDSGGPLVVTDKHGPPYFLAGIVSFGFSPCGQYNFPGVCTNVADYRNWIIDNMRP